MLMNSGFILDQAKHLAGRLIAETPSEMPLPASSTSTSTTSARWETHAEPETRERAALARMIAYAWTVAYQRPITADELDAALGFVAEQIGPITGGKPTETSTKAQADRQASALTNLCQQILSSNEFLYVD